MFSEWLYLPQASATFLGDPTVWLFLAAGVFLGFVVGVVPGLGPTMGMALCLGIIFRLDYAQGMALLVGIFVASCGSGGITASLINIPGTPAAAATCLDGYALTKQGRGREAVGYSIFASVVGTLAGTVLIFLIQPFVTNIALKFGDWETFLFCVFGLLICGSISRQQPPPGLDCGAGRVPDVHGGRGRGPVGPAVYLWPGGTAGGLQQRHCHAGPVRPGRGPLYPAGTGGGPHRGENRLPEVPLEGIKAEYRQHGPLGLCRTLDWLYSGHRRIRRLLVLL